MLDDLKYVHEKDAQDALGVAENQWKQLCEKFTTTLTADNYQNVVVGSMGGSALASLIVSVCPGVKVPFQVVRDYDIPGYVGESTLFVAASYSGNTEETLSALAQAESKGAKIAVIAAGGKLLEIAKEKNYPHIVLPRVSQPRYATLVGFKAILTILADAGVVDKANLEEVEEAADWLRTATQAWIPTKPTSHNYAKQLALELIGKSIVVYSGPKMHPAAYKWKISFNENAKQVSWVNQLPEFSHNEFIGWTKQPEDKPYAVIDIRSSQEHSQTQKRFEITERLLSGVRPMPLVVSPEGETLMQQLLWVIALGDFTSLYVALLNGINPTPVDLIEKFKKDLES